MELSGSNLRSDCRRRGVAPFYPLPAGLGKHAARRFSGLASGIGRRVRQRNFKRRDRGSRFAT
jgi:hypothetical protein